MIMICLLPQFLIVSANVPFYLGGTSLLIAVVVVMDFMAMKSITTTTAIKSEVPPK